MTQSYSISRKMGDFFCKMRYEDLPESLTHQIKFFLLDWIASAFAGASEPPTRIILSLLGEMKGSSEATVLADQSRHSPLMAALANGAASHVREMDDLHRPSIFHPAASILPAVFAAAEKSRISGPQLILAILAGYETGIRTALAAGKTHYEFWHTTATCGTFGAAAGSAVAIGLTPRAFAWALGSAGTQSSGLWEFLTDGAMSKQLHTAKSSMNGLLAAFLAQKGFTGADHIFEGEKGFLKATSRDFDLDALIEGLGVTFHTSENSLKYYASCGHTHSAIDAALDARARLGRKHVAIRSVHVQIYQEALDLLQGVAPTTAYFAKFNLPFCVATALTFGHVDTDDFTKDRLHHSEIIRLMDCTNLESDPQLSSLYPWKWPARVKITWSDGSETSGYCEDPKGEPRNPLSEDELIEKFHKLCNGVLSRGERSRIIDSVMHLEEINDVSRIFHV